MDIQDILKSLNIDLSDPEAKRGAAEALAAILAGRYGPEGNFENPFNSKASRQDPDKPTDLGEHEFDIDPNLIQPPSHNSGNSNNIETEIEDEENLLDKIKQAKNDAPEVPDDSKNKPEEPEKSGPDPDSEPEGPKPDGPDGPSKSGNGSKDKSNDSKPGDEPGNEPGTKPDDGPEGEPGDEPGEEPGDIPPEPTEPEEYSDDDFSSQLADTNPKNESQKIQISRTLNAAKNALDKAKAQKVSKIQTKMLEKCCELLEDMLDELENNPDDSINDQKVNQIINKTLDTIAEIDQQSLSIKTQDEHEQQVKKIKDDMSDAVTAAELSAEDAEQIRKDRQSVAAAQKEIDKYAPKTRSSFKGFEEFIFSLKRAMALQTSTETAKAGSWAAINRKHDGTSVVMQGIKNKTLPDGRIPVIDFYFDQSGSWDADDIKKGNEALSQIAQLEQDGLIKINIFYFADGVYPEPSPCRWDSGTGAWNKIIENIITTRATNVVIMTDRDMERQCDDPPHKGYKIPGFVWFLWRDGVNAPKLPQLLQGKSGTLQYAFDSH